MRKIYILIFALLSFATSIQAQISKFCFTATAGTYTQLSGSTAVTGIQADDNNTTGIPIGFAFNYLGNNYTLASVSSNGWLSFANADPSDANSRSNNLAVTGIPALLNTLYPLWDDLSGANGTASYQLSGAAGSRVFTMEWRNWRWNYQATATISFQVKLYEGSNVIEFIYRQEAAAVISGSASIGLTDGTGGSTHFLSLNSTNANPGVSSTVSTNNLSTKPANGQVYRFTPSLVPTISGITPNPVCATGTTVTISGTNFNACVSGVTFNGTAAPVFAYINPTTITAVVPGAATTGTVSVTTPGGTANSPSALQIGANGTIALSSGISSPSVCIGNAITNIVLTTGGFATGATLTGTLPPGVTGSFSPGSYTISGTPTAAGTFSYTVSATGAPCTNGSINGTITVNNNSTLALSSAVTTNAQSICLGSGITNIIYNTGGGATGATVSGLPAGVTGIFAGNVFTISGTPSVAGLFNYTVATTGPCVNTSLTGSISITNNGSIVLSSAAGTNTQVACLSNAITAINYTIGGNATSASIVSGSLPPGLVTDFNAGVFTISGTAGATGLYNFTVGTAGSPCNNPTLSGTITVNENATIALSSAVGTDAQVLCALSPLANITYAVGGFGTTGAVASGLPAGVTGIYNAGVFTISGSPTVNGTFNYSVTTTGTCGTPAAFGSIVSNNNGTVTLSSPAGTNAQAVCLNNALATVTYAVDASATGASITSGGLPAGVTGNFAGSVFTISGTPTVSGIFNYTVTASGSPCANQSASGSITVNENATISLSSASGTDAQVVCINSGIAAITYSVGGFGTTGGVTSGLPAGVNAVYASGIVTISGTPGVSGNFNYTVTSTGPCGTPAAFGSITVNANSTLSLSSGAGSNNQTKCINNALTNISFTTGGGATGATLSAGSFPAGVTGTFAAGVFTISGTATASGSFPYTITTTGPCINPTANGVITINDDATISLSSAVGSNTQSVCVGSGIAPITYAIGGSGTGANVTGLPGGVTASYSAGMLTISGTTTVAGTFNYTLTSTGPCVKPALGGSITVTANATITRTSAAATTTQTICINNPITAITYSIGGSGTGATVTGLPTGINGVFNAGVFTITGTPNVSGLFNYTVTSTGPCGTPSLSGTVTVNADATIALNSAPATTTQTLCVNTPITNITYAIGDGGTGATTTGLPAGLTVGYNATTHIYTISGTPTAAGIFNYTVTTSGPCVKPSLGGTISVTANATITRTSSAASTTQTLCINTAIGVINYSLGGSATGAVVTGLPAGVNAVINATSVSISGTPNVPGSFSYLVTTTGPCGTPALGGTITVNDDATILLTSAASTTSQIKCINTPITNITYSIGGGGTGATVIGLPAGLVTAYNAGTRIFTISGIPTASGTFNYTVTASGPCVKPSLGGTITVTPNATIALSSGTGSNLQTLCTFASITNITYAIGGSGNGATTAGLPAGVTGSYTAGVYTISGSPTVSGTFNYTVTTTGPCLNVSASGTLTVKVVPTGTLTATETSGTPNNNIICAGANVTFTATSGYGSYIFKSGGATVQSGTSNVYNSTSLANGASITVEVANGVNCGATFGPVIITVNALPVPTLISNKTSICPGENLLFTATGGTSYTFNVNGSAVQSGAANTFNSTTLTNGNTVTVTVTNSNGCSATSSPITINVNMLPVGTLTASATSVCTGTNVAFTATAGYTNYNFKVNGSSVQNSAANIYNSSTLTNPSVVTVDVTNASNCVATFGPLVITVNSLPVGTLSATENSGTANDNTICAGTDILFTATSGFTGYDFQVNNISQQNSASNIFSTSTLNNNDIVKVVVTNGTNCIATFSSVQITVLAAPAGSLAASPLTSCAGENIDLTATAGFSNYDFKVNGSTVQNGAANIYSSTGLLNGDVVTVEVTGSFCSTFFNSIVISITPLPSGTLTISENSGVAPNDGSICTGAPVVFTGPTGFTNYNFLLNNVSVQNGASNTYANSALVNGDQVTVAVTNAGSCIAILNNWIMTVSAYPVVATITGTTSICVGGTTTLGNATAGGTWSSSNNLLATVNAAGVVTGISAGTPIITYNITNAGGCVSTASALVTVNALPVVPAIIGATSVCVSNNIQLSNTAGSGVWSSDNTAVAVVNTAGLVTGISGGITNISYTVTNGNNCSATSSVAITINEPPVLNPITGDVTICIGSTSQLANDTDGGIWSINNTSIATINSSTGLVSTVSPGTATISYAVTDGNGCSDIETINVTVSALPIPTLAGPNPICPNSTGVYITEPGQFGYTWTFTGGTLVSGGSTTDNTITILWDQPGPKTIFVNYTNADGCLGATSATVATSTSVVPALTGPVDVCLNANGTYTTDDLQSDYAWTVAGGNITAGGTSTDNTATITWTTAGNGSVSINYTDVNGCVVITPTTLAVSVHTLPTASLSGSTGVCQNGTNPLLTFIGANGAAPYTFTYNINGGTTQTITTTSGNSVTLPVATSTAGTFVYNLVSVADNNTCLNAQALTATVTINELPTAIISGTASVCQNAAAPLISFNGTTGTAPFTFSYNINGGLTQFVTTVSGNSVSIPAATSVSGNFVYNLLSVSDANGCTQIQSGSASVTVNASPTAIITGTTAVCQNAASPSITITGNAGTAPYTFTYNINGGGNLSIISTGNTATITVPTNIAGVFVYNLVSVQDAGASLCSQAQTGAATVTVNAPSAGGSIATSTAVCAGTNSGTLVLTGHTGNVIGWQFSTNGGSTWTAIANTTTSLTYNNLVITTLYQAIVQNGSCASATSGIATITVSEPSVGGTVNSSVAVCSGSNSGTLTLSGHTGSVTRWEFSINGGSTWSPIANTTTTLNYNNLTQTTRYRAVVSNGTCAAANSVASIITVNALPTATISGSSSVCLNAPSPVITFTGANGTAPYTFTYKINTGGNLTLVSTGNTATINAPTATAGVFTYTLISVQGSAPVVCSQTQTGSATITVNALPSTFIITPASAAICQGNVQPLSAAGSTPTSGTLTFSSGNINLAIPEGNRAHTIAVSGIPAGAVINSATVNFNITHGYDSDLEINLRAPNANTLNLVNKRGGSGNNFVNTTISSISVNPLNSGTAPFSNTYAADAANNVGTPNSNTGTFAGLFSTPNGNWTINAEDVVGCHGGAIVCFFGGGDYYTGTLNSWSITFNYTIPNSPVSVVWSPLTGLFTDAGATTAYAGQPLATVYAKPNATILYTATATNAANCSATKTVNVNVSPTPVVTISSDYCVVPNKVRLTATSVPAATSYIWSNGATTAFIDVDIAGSFDVTVFAGGGCPGGASIEVAQELVTNGDFSAGNSGFVTPPLGGNQYIYVADGAGNNELNPEGLYGIGPDAHTYHNGFWGHDHTTGTGNFMIINGFPNGNPQPIVWQQTVNVLPNTNYYFSAWGMSVNAAGPFAQLQFNVNGAQVGSIATLPAGVNNNSNNGWTRFYGTLTTGPTTTTAVISITDLQNSPGGNDFGLDDISFATLSTFITLQSAPGTNAQTLCVNTPLTNIVYSVGNGNPTGPTVSGLPAGVTSTYSGGLLTISGTPAVAGTYSYTITTTGTCLPTSASGTITVQGQAIALSSGTATPVTCVNTAVSIGYTLSGTATGATASGLPAGVSGSLSGNIYTISGSTATSGTFPFTVTTTGTCTAVSITGSITVQAQTITLNSANNIQTVCINSAISNIQYTASGTATGVTVTGLPTGVNFSYNSGILFISGNPSASGSFNYTVNTSGSCTSVSATGTINVTPAASLTLTSGTGTNNQTICRNTSISNITYTVNGGTNAFVTGLPAGISGTFSAGVFTLSGTATVNGSFNYTITTTGGCGSGTAVGIIVVQSQTIALTSGVASPSTCVNVAMTNIVYTIGGNATGANVVGLPAGVSSSVSGNLLTISGTASLSGSFAYTVTTTGTCTPATAGGTITVQPGAVGGTVASVTICSGGSGTLTVTGHSGNIVRWEFTTDGGVTWTTIANTTITQTYNNVTDPTGFRAVVNNGCGIGYSSAAMIAIRNYWTGITNTDWNTASNWGDNLVPSAFCADVHIKGGKPNQPTLNASTATVENIYVYTGAILTINNATLRVTGGIINAGVIIAGNGSLDLASTSSQLLAAGTFQNNALNNLIISNTSANGVTLGGPLDVYRSITYTGTGKKFNTAGFLTLKSTATETAWLGDMTGNVITGNATVERYIATGIGGAPNHGKSWQLLAVPTTGQTIKQAWQEGATTVNGNPAPGFGTMLTSNVPNAATQPDPGFDVFTAPGPSIKVYNSVTNVYDGPASTSLPLYNAKGYFLLVRGDRSVTAYNQDGVPTVLRSKGALFTPSNPPAVTNVMADKLESVGNPYASALDLRNIGRTGGTNEFFYVWDPRLGGINNLGAYQTLFKVGSNYFAMPGGGSYGAGINNFIQSGQAFLVQATGTNGTVTFSEAAKSNGSALLFRNNETQFAAQPRMLKTNLYTISSTGSTSLADGTLNIFGDDYSSAIDGFDAKKPSNTGENLSVKIEDKLFAIERRHSIDRTDTIFLNLANTRVQAYQFEFIASDMSNGLLEGFVEDQYLGVRTALNMTGTTLVNFTIANIPGSYASNRFRIVFTNPVVLPVKFTAVKAYRRESNINVEWKVENEVNVKQYVVEKSTNGYACNSLTVAAPTNNNNGAAAYLAVDSKPVSNYNYYRIRSVDNDGKIQYSEIVKVFVEAALQPEIAIYPNPITNGVINLQLTNQPAGEYNISLYDKIGQVILKKKVNRAEGSSTEKINWDFNLAHGMYHLEVVFPNGNKKIIKVLY